MNDLTFTSEGFADYIYWQFEDRKTLRRINLLLEDIKRNGVLNGMGKPEKLKYEGAYSRRIDEQNRLIYKLNSIGDIEIVSCRGHYED